MLKESRNYSKRVGCSRMHSSVKYAERHGIRDRNDRPWNSAFAILERKCTSEGKKGFLIRNVFIPKYLYLYPTTAVSIVSAAAQYSFQCKYDPNFEYDVYD